MSTSVTAVLDGVTSSGGKIRPATPLMVRVQVPCGTDVFSLPLLSVVPRSSTRSAPQGSAVLVAVTLRPADVAARPAGVTLMSNGAIRASTEPVPPGAITVGAPRVPPVGAPAGSESLQLPEKAE